MMEAENHRYTRHDVPKFDLITQFIPEDKPLVLLDYACNVGTFCRYLEEQRPQLTIYGTDLNSTFTDRAHLLSTGEKQDKVTYFPLDKPQEMKVDILTMMEVVEHVHNTEQYFRDVVERFLKPGGLLVISTPRETFPQGPHVQIWDYTRLFNFCWFWLGTDAVTFKYTPTDNTMICCCRPKLADYTVR